MSATASLMTEIMTVSRLKYKPDFIPMKSVCTLPQLNSGFNKSFEQISLERGEDLWKNSVQNNSLSLLWSGGIDSTVALIAMLRTCPAGSHIDLYCNMNSIIENNSLYCKLLSDPRIRLKNSSIIPNNHSINLITGELGDQVFGSDLLFRIAANFGFNNLFNSYQEIIPQLFNNRCGPVHGAALFDRYEPIVNEAPFKIKTAFDFIWWWNFTQKWQCVKFRKEGLIDEKHKALHFFEYDDFQLWSIHNHPAKISTDLESYKMPAKEFIYKYDQDAVYQKNKKKYGSPFGNKRYFYVLYDDRSKLYTWDECNKLIDQHTTQISY